MSKEGIQKDADNTDQPGDYEWAASFRRAVIHNAPFNGEIGIVTLPIKVLFEWSDKIVADFDEDTGAVLEYTSGFIMKIAPEEVVYKGQDIIHHSSVMIEKK